MYPIRWPVATKPMLFIVKRYLIKFDIYYFRNSKYFNNDFLQRIYNIDINKNSWKVQRMDFISRARKERIFKISANKFHKKYMRSLKTYKNVGGINQCQAICHSFLG